MSAWQSIDSAPKDGRGVLAWRDGWERPSWVRWICNPRTNTEFWNDIIEYDAYDLEQAPPTHWIALPPLPVLTSEAA